MSLITQQTLTIIRRIYRLLALVAHLLTGLVLTFLFTTIMKCQHHDPLYSSVIKWWLSRISTIMGLQITVIGKAPLKSILYVSNHVSWIDIPILGGALNPQFIAKHELRHALAIGWIAERAGTLFINRGQHEAAATMNIQINERLQAGQQVLFFPEGSRGNGRNLRRFFSRLFSSAITTNTPVQPLVIRYLDKGSQGGNTILVKEKQGAANQLWSLLGTSTLKVELHLLPLINPIGMTRNQLASTCEKLIREQL